MTDHEKKIEIMRKYYKEIKTSFDFFIKGDIPIKRVDNALKKFASGMDRTTMIGFYDTTVMGSGKADISSRIPRYIIQKLWKSLKSYGMTI